MPYDNTQLLNNLINLKNSPQDFANNPIQASSDTIKGAGEMLGGTLNATYQSAADILNGILKPATQGIISGITNTQDPASFKSFGGGSPTGAAAVGSWDDGSPTTVNPATGLDNNQADALKNNLDKYDNQSAKEAISIHGRDAMAQLLNFHYASSKNNYSTDNQGSAQQASQPDGEAYSSGDTNLNNDQVKQQLQDNINKTALKATSEPSSVIGKVLKVLFPGFDMVTNKIALGNAKSAQSLLGMQQGPEVELLRAQKKEIQQKIAGLTPAQQAEATAGYNTAVLKQQQDSLQASHQRIANLTSSMDELVKNTPTLDRSYGSVYYKKLNDYHDELRAETNRSGEIIKNLQDLQLANPKNVQMNNTPQNENQKRIVSQIQSKVGKYTLVGSQ